MSTIAADPDLLEASALNAERLSQGLQGSFSAIRSLPLGGLEPSTRGRTQAAIDVASAQARSAASRSAGQGHELRRRATLARRADDGGDRTTFLSRFWSAFQHPDNYTLAGWVLSATTLPRDIRANVAKRLRDDRLARKGAQHARRIFDGSRAARRKYGTPEKMRQALFGSKGHLRDLRKLDARLDPKKIAKQLGSAALRSVPILSHPAFGHPSLKSLPGKALQRVPKGAGKALPKSVPVLGQVLTYKSAKAQGRSDLDAVAKTIFTTGGGMLGGAAGVGAAGLAIPATGGGSALAAPVAGLFGVVLGSHGASSLYDAVIPPPDKTVVYSGRPRIPGNVA